MGNDIENTGKTQLDMDLKKLNEYEMTTSIMTGLHNALLAFKLADVFFYFLNALYAN